MGDLTCAFPEVSAALDGEGPPHPATWGAQGLGTSATWRKQGPREVGGQLQQ